MTAKKQPCPECFAAGREPHTRYCSIGEARSIAAFKNQASRKKVGKRTQTPVTATVAAIDTLAESKVAQQVNRIALVFDRSTSMSRIFQPAINALNAQINAIKMEAARTGQPTYVSVYDFGSDVRCLFRDQYVHAINEIGVRDISLAGMTALMDGVGVAARDFESLSDAQDENVSFLIMTITDGRENRSRQYSQRSFVDLIERLNGTDRWTFVFSGPRDSRSFLERLGVHPGNIQEWDQTEAGVADMTFNANVGVTRYMTTRAAGGQSTKEFFTVNMSQVAEADIKNMTDVSSSFKILKVDNADADGREWQIRLFVEDRITRNKTFGRQVQAGAYSIGLAYYQLTKPEDVQPSKDLVVREKTSGRIFGGNEARALIGMPVHVRVRVKPGNFGNWDIFVKSTSVNRKLVRGTDLLYRIR